MIAPMWRSSRLTGGTTSLLCASSDKSPRIGDWVLAVGNPFGLGGTVTAGIVSARGRDIGAGPYDDFIQIDAAVNKGNSGGPTFDMDGNVIGVNTAIFSPSGGSVGIAFDIPAETVKAVVAQLKDHGAVTRGWIGVQIQPVTAEIADSLGLKNARGALVAEPQSGSPAAKAGIKAGDVIVSVNDEPVNDARTLARRISALAPGTSGQARRHPRRAGRHADPDAWRAAEGATGARHHRGARCNAKLDRSAEARPLACATAQRRRRRGGDGDRSERRARPIASRPATSSLTSTARRFPPRPMCARRLPTRSRAAESRY